MHRLCARVGAVLVAAIGGEFSRPALVHGPYRGCMAGRHRLLQSSDAVKGNGSRATAGISAPSQL